MHDIARNPTPCMKCVCVFESVGDGAFRFLYVCVIVYKMCVRVSAWAPIHVLDCVSLCLCACMCVSFCLSVFVFLFFCGCARVSVCLCLFVCVYLFAFLCVCPCVWVSG